MSASDACQREVFCAAYSLRKTSQDTREKLIVNMLDIDHGMCHIVVRMSGPWEAE